MFERDTTQISQFANEHRAFLMFLALFVFFSLTAPDFFNVYNVTTLLKGASLNVMVAIGFTIILITGELDLSIGSVMMFCGMLVVGLKPSLGWIGSFLVALSVGACIGVVNGLLVTKVRINSFIATLGTMIILEGVMHLYSGGNSMFVADFSIPNVLETSYIPLLPLRVIITIVAVVLFHVLLTQTAFGRRIFLIGGNEETAWLAGIQKDWYKISSFVLCAVLSALGGMLFAMSLASMSGSAILGKRTLMTVLAAVIIGGAGLDGGKGNVVKSTWAVLMLTTLFNGIGNFGLGFEMQIFINGAILAAVVLYEAYAERRAELMEGQRSSLLQERDEHSGSGEDRASGANRSYGTGLLVICTVIAFVVVFAWKGMSTWSVQKVQDQTSDEENLRASRQVDTTDLMAKDGQPLIVRGTKPEIPDRPEHPGELPKTDAGHWWDMEHAGWKAEKVNIPDSPESGAIGKDVVLLKAGDHPYWTAYVRGFKKIADAYDMDIKIFNSNWNMDLQAQQTRQAINARPDAIIVAPVDARASTILLRRINQAGIPVFASNTLPSNKGMKYVVSWTGPDDWGQFRMLARTFADEMDKSGNYAIIRHMPGSSPYFARTWAVRTELNGYAPEMELLDMDTAQLKSEATKQLVSDWLTKHGDELDGIVLPGDGFSMTGTIQALESAGKEPGDITIVAAGSSETGLDAVKNGWCYAMTYQSAEADGALALQTAADWFNGRDVPPVRYIPKKIINSDNVDNFTPAQW